MWLPDDTDAALAWQEVQDDRCGGCGHSRTESMSPNGPDYQAVPLRCRACEAKDALEAKWQRDEHADLHGLRIAVTERGE